jgi:hypothetical protein
VQFDVASTQSRRDVGQAAVVLVVVVCAVFASAAAALSTMGSSLVERVRAQTAADAVALASLAGGRSFGVELAERHSATIVSMTLFDAGDGRVVQVVVRLGEATAAARATDGP